MGILEILRGKKKEITDNEIAAGEFRAAGIDFNKGDYRLKEGITRDKLTDEERKKLDMYRQQQNEG